MKRMSAGKVMSSAFHLNPCLIKQCMGGFHVFHSPTSGKGLVQDKYLRSKGLALVYFVSFWRARQ